MASRPASSSPSPSLVCLPPLPLVAHGEDSGGKKLPMRQKTYCIYLCICTARGAEGDSHLSKKRKKGIRTASVVAAAADEAVGSRMAEEPSVVEKEDVPFADAPSPVRAVLNRPWPDTRAIAPSSPSGKWRTLVATADEIGDPISEEEFAALEDKEGDDLCTRSYKQAARADALMRNYIHKHGSLYLDDKGKYIVDASLLLEKIRCKKVTAEEMQELILKKDNQSTYLSVLALGSYNKSRRVKLELWEQLLCRTFWEDRGFFWHLNFVAKRKNKKILFFAEIEDFGRQGPEILKARCCIPLDSLSEGGYYNFPGTTPSRPRKGLDMDRCHACTEYLKHPCNGSTYSGGHDYRRKTYLF